MPSTALARGGSQNDHRVEQYDAVYPVAPDVMEEWRHYRDRHWERLDLGPDDPLIPGEGLTRPISGETMHEWFREAEFLAEKDGRPLKLPPQESVTWLPGQPADGVPKGA